MERKSTLRHPHVVPLVIARIDPPDHAERLIGAMRENAAVERTLRWLLGGEYDELQAMVDAIDSQVNESVPGVG